MNTTFRLDDPKILPDGEFDKIVKTVPSSRDRVRLHTHDAVVRWMLKNEVPAEAQAKPDADLEKKVALRIADWINNHERHLGKSTVRADYARSIVKMMFEEEPWKSE